jgi:hypothetical protein
MMCAGVRLGLFVGLRFFFEGEATLGRFFFEFKALIIGYLPEAVKSDRMQQSPWLV